MEQVQQHRDDLRKYVRIYSHVIIVSLEHVYWFSKSQWHMLIVRSIYSHLMISNLLLFFSM